MPGSLGHEIQDAKTFASWVYHICIHYLKVTFHFHQNYIMYNDKLLTNTNLYFSLGSRLFEV
jgi:hypothetical protein